MDRPRPPDPQPGDEQLALVQRLDFYRATAASALVGLTWEDASARLLPATDLTIAGIVKHLAWGCDSLDQVAAVPSFGSGPVNARWILVHMIDETARHAGHLDLLRDCVSGRA